MEVALPYRLHNHQHGTLDNAVCQGRYTQWSQLAIRFRDVDSLDRLRAIGAFQQACPQVSQMLIELRLQSLLIHSVNARRSSAA